MSLPSTLLLTSSEHPFGAGCYAESWKYKDDRVVMSYGVIYCGSREEGATGCLNESVKTLERRGCVCRVLKGAWEISFSYELLWQNLTYDPSNLFPWKVLWITLTTKMLHAEIWKHLQYFPGNIFMVRRWFFINPFLKGEKLLLWLAEQTTKFLK